LIRFENICLNDRVGQIDFRGKKSGPHICPEFRPDVDGVGIDESLW
jgi:hypothetical protein